MLQLLKSEILKTDTSTRALRSFGLLVGGVLVLIAALVVWRTGWQPGTLAYILGATGSILMLFGWTAPRILKPVYLVWMALALVLGFVMTRVILTAVFYLAVTPTGLALRLFGKDPLQRKIDPDTTTYWIPKHYDDPSPSRLEKYY